MSVWHEISHFRTEESQTKSVSSFPLDRKPRFGTTIQVPHNINTHARVLFEKNDTPFTKISIEKYINCSSYN